MGKNNLKEKLFFYTIIIVIIIILNINFALADNSTIKNQNNTSFSNNFIFEYDESVIEKDRNLIVPADTTVIIKNPNNRITIVPPKGTDFVDYSNNTINLVLSNFEIKTINLNNSITFFTPINFISSINGLNRYIFTICYNENFSIQNINDDFLTYSIDWGSGDITKGNGSIPPIAKYIYNESGNYKIIINLTDKNGISYIYTWNHTLNLNTEQFLKLWAIENKETVAVSSVGTFGLLTFLGFALTETGKYKLLSILLLSFPMFIKTQKEDVLDHFVRGQIYGYIKAYPGAHYNQIMRELDIKNGTLSYHLYILEKTGLIKSRKEHFRYRVFYPIDINFPKEERYRLTELQLNILNLINKKRGINQKFIAKKLNEKHQTISYNLRVLQKAGLININRKGRKKYYYINQEKHNILKV